MFKQAQDVLLQKKQSRPIKEKSPYLLTGFMKCSKCGSPLGGTTLNGKYRYYQCRGARPTATRGKICDAGYIKASALETPIWDKVIDMFYSPLSILTRFHEAGRIGHNTPDNTSVILEKQINQLRKKLKTYPTREKRLYELLAHDKVTQALVLETVADLKKELQRDENQLKELIARRKDNKKFRILNIRLSELSQKLRG